jgi:hypothetical protein
MTMEDVLTALDLEEGLELLTRTTSVEPTGG